MFCPESGKTIAFCPTFRDLAVMSGPAELADLVAYLVRTTRLNLPEATRLVDEEAVAMAPRRREHIRQQPARESTEATSIPPAGRVYPNTHQRHSLKLFPTPVSAPIASPSAQAVCMRASYNSTGNRVIRRPEPVIATIVRAVSTIGSRTALAT